MTLMIVSGWVGARGHIAIRCIRGVVGCYGTVEKIGIII